MLVLSRKVGERININERITIELLGIFGARAKLGIQAPKEVQIRREEIYQKVLAHKNRMNKKSS